MFKTTISNVPTQLNKGLEKPAFEIDKSFLAFYKNTLNTLYNNLPKATDIGKTIPQTTDSNGFNSFENNNIFEENLPQTNLNQDDIKNHSTDENNSHFLLKNQDGVEIFE